jgi:hypothetical protein
MSACAHTVLPLLGDGRKTASCDRKPVAPGNNDSELQR